MGAEGHTASITGISIDPARQREVVAALRGFMPEHTILYRDEQTRPYECDGLSAYRQLPMVVALPETEQQVAQVLKTCHALKVPVVPRGAGTGLSGGALPSAEGVLLGMAKFNRILWVDPLARIARVQTGVRNVASTLDLDGSRYTWTGVVTQTVFDNGKPTDLDGFWRADGEVRRDGEAWGQYRLAPTGVYISIVLDTPDGAVELQTFQTY